MEALNLCLGKHIRFPLETRILRQHQLTDLSEVFVDTLKFGIFQAYFKRRTPRRPGSFISVFKGPDIILYRNLIPTISITMMIIALYYPYRYSLAKCSAIHGDKSHCPPLRLGSTWRRAVKQNARLTPTSGPADACTRVLRPESFPVCLSESN